MRRVVNAAIDDGTLRVLGAELLIAAVLVLTTMGVVVWALVRVGRMPGPIALVTALSLLSTLAIFGYVATAAEPLATIAASGVGAIAGAVSATWTKEGDRDG